MLSVAAHIAIRFLVFLIEVATINIAPQWQANPRWAQAQCRESRFSKSKFLLNHDGARPHASASTIGSP